MLIEYWYDTNVEVVLILEYTYNQLLCYAKFCKNINLGFELI